MDSGQIWEIELCKNLNDQWSVDLVVGLSVPRFVVLSDFYFFNRKASLCVQVLLELLLYFSNFENSHECLLKSTWKVGEVAMLKSYDAETWKTSVNDCKKHLSSHCIFSFVLPCHSNTGYGCQRVWKLWTIKCKTTSFLHPCCSHMTQHEDAKVGRAIS